LIRALKPSCGSKYVIEKEKKKEKEKKTLRDNDRFLGLKKKTAQKFSPPKKKATNKFKILVTSLVF